MKNFVPLGTGNSRLMKSSIPAGTTWEQALAMLIAGTFPYDTGQLNAAGISQQGDPLNKNTLLKDATAQSYGGDETMVPDDVLGKLAGSLKVEIFQTKTKELAKDWFVSEEYTPFPGSNSDAYKIRGDAAYNGTWYVIGCGRYIYSTKDFKTWKKTDAYRYVNGSRNGSALVCEANGKFYTSTYAGCNGYSTYVYEFDPETETFTHKGSDLANPIISTANGVIFLQSATSSTCYIYYSSDNGATWNMSNLSSFGISGEPGIKVAYCNGVYVMALSNKGFFRSTDGGASWSSVSGISKLSGQGVHMGLCSFKGKFYYAIDKTVKSSQDGATWVTDTLPSTAIYAPITNGDILCYSYISGGTVCYTIDGTEWETVSLPSGTVASTSYVFSAYKRDTDEFILQSPGSSYSVFASRNVYEPLYRLLTPAGVDNTELVASALGLPGVKIATGSYTGTGEGGQSNPCSLTFEFEPKVVFIDNSGSTTYYDTTTYVWGATRLWVTSTAYSDYNNVTVSGNTMSWYSPNGDLVKQLNISGVEYKYIAIG